MYLFRSTFLWAALGLSFLSGLLAETLPPRPAHYFNDSAGVISPQKAAELDQRLENFERETSNQFIVALYPRMSSSSSIEDFTVRIAQSWGIGQKEHNNGIVLFVFMAEHKAYLQVGYGLEGALPDALCHQILADELTPRFKTNDYNGGLDSTIAAVISASRGEYRGNGRTRAETSISTRANPTIILLLVVFIVVAGHIASRMTSGNRTISSGRRRICGGSNWIGSNGWGGSGGNSSGSGGFSSGGGSFGGGGAGGSW